MYEMMKIGLQLMINIMVAFLPLRVTEPLMVALNPAMGARRRVAGYDPAGYRQIDWNEMETKQKTVLLKKARDERRRTGTFNLDVGERPNPAQESAGLALNAKQTVAVATQTD